MNQEKIGKFIAQCRKDTKLTQEQLATKLGISDRAISKWENGKCLMDISFLKPLSEILGVSIVEILNGEKIEKDNVCVKTDEVALNTLNYANKEVKRGKLKSTIITIIVTIILFLTLFIVYKCALLAKYHVDPVDNIKTYTDNMRIKNTINIYKKTINIEDYLVEGDIKIRNDFNYYIREKEDNIVKYSLYNNDKIEARIAFTKESQYIDNFTSESMFIYSSDDDFGDADRKYFLLRNDINNDLDLFEYIRKNYYMKSNLFTSKRVIKENSAINRFVLEVLPSMESMTLITGDYTGYIFNIREDIREVHILRNGKSYCFSFFGKNITSDEYIQDLLSTLEIK